MRGVELAPIPRAHVKKKRSRGVYSEESMIVAVPVSKVEAKGLEKKKN